MFHPEKGILSYEGEKELTKTEVSILKILMQQRERLLTARKSCVIFGRMKLRGRKHVNR